MAQHGRRAEPGSPSRWRQRLWASHGG